MRANVKSGLTARIEGVKETLQLLDAVQPGAIKELRKDIKRIAAPAVSAIQARIPAAAPLSGMEHYGRTRYRGAKASSQLLLGANRFAESVPLVRLVAASPDDGAGFEIADMAGRRSMQGGPQLPYQYKGRGRPGGSGRQNPTMSRPVTRRGNGKSFSYRINRNGKKTFVQALGGSPSRFVYPAVAGKVQGIADDMLKTLEGYTARINQKLKVR